MASIEKGIVKPYPQFEQYTKKDGSVDYKQTMLIETYGQYPKLVAFTINGTDKINDVTSKWAVGSAVEVHFNAESREYQGRYYTELRLWKVESGSQTQQQQPAAQQPAAQQPAAQPQAAQQPTYTVGQIVNGQQLGADMQWHPVQAAAPQQQQYQIGQVVNGHQWNGSAWLPAPAAAPAAAPMQQYNNPNPTNTNPVQQQQQPPAPQQQNFFGAPGPNDNPDIPF